MTRMESIRQWLKRCWILARARLKGNITGQEFANEFPEMARRVVGRRPRPEWERRPAEA